MLDHLFELIRKEETILFIGSGCSVNAGMPTGKGLVRILYNKLSPSEKEEVSDSISLPDMAEAFERRRDRNELINEVLEIFSRKSENQEFHDKLSKIPFWKTIITTNYDVFIEDSIGIDKCNVIHNDKDCTYLNNRKKHIFKIHGDITNKDEIIITKRDYDCKAFINDSHNPLMWGVIQSEMLIKNVIFLGYSMGDGNIENILENIKKNVGSHVKGRYIIASGWNIYDIKRVESDGIKYINLNCIDFINLLKENIDNNLVDDLQEGNIENIRQVFFEHNLSPIIKLLDDNKSILADLETTDGSPLEVKANLQISKERAKEIFNPILSYNPPPIILNNSELISFNASASGIPFLKKNNTDRIEIHHNPQIQKKVNLRFQNGFQYNNLPIKIYKNKVCPSITFDLSIMDGSIHSFEHNKEKLIFKFTHNLKPKCNNIRKSIHDIELLEHIISGEQFIIEKQTYGINPQNISETFLNLKKYYSAILDIQNYYNCSFKNFDNFSDESMKKVLLVHSYVKKYGFIHKIDNKIIFKPRRGPSDIENGDFFAFLCTDTEEPITYNLFEKKIKIGYRYILYPNCQVNKIYDTNNQCENLSIDILNKKAIEYYNDAIPEFNFKHFLMLKIDLPDKFNIEDFHNDIIRFASRDKNISII